MLVTQLLASQLAEPVTLRVGTGLARLRSDSRNDERHVEGAGVLQGVWLLWQNCSQRTGEKQYAGKVEDGRVLCSGLLGSPGRNRDTKLSKILMT